MARKPKRPQGRPRKDIERAKYKKLPQPLENEDGELYFTVAQVVEYTGLHEQTIQARLRDGTLKGKKLGKCWYIDATQDAFIEE